MTKLPEYLKQVSEREAKAHREICDLASRKKEWRMCVPPQKDDSDMTLQAPLDDVPTLLKIIDILHKEMKHVDCDQLIARHSRRAQYVLNECETLAAKAMGEK